MSSSESADPVDEVAAFVADLGYETLSTGAGRIAERCFIDTTGVALAGVTEGAGRVAADARGETGTGDAGDHSGCDAVTAYVAGFETMCYLGAPVIEPLNRAGGFSTPILGTVDAAAAVADLWSLGPAETRTAVEIPGALAAGTLRYNSTMTELVQVGHAAQTGGGPTRPGWLHRADALTGPKGFYDRHVGVETPSLGTPPSAAGRLALLEDGVHLKEYPYCSDAHTSIAATEALVAAHDLTSEAVTDVTVRVSERALDVLRHHDPETGRRGGQWATSNRPPSTSSTNSVGSNVVPSVTTVDPPSGVQPAGSSTSDSATGLTVTPDASIRDTHRTRPYSTS